MHLYCSISIPRLSSCKTPFETKSYVRKSNKKDRIANMGPEIFTSISTTNKL